MDPSEHTQGFTLLELVVENKHDYDREDEPVAVNESEALSKVREIAAHASSRSDALRVVPCRRINERSDQACRDKESYCCKPRYVDCPHCGYQYPGYRRTDQQRDLLDSLYSRVGPLDYHSGRPGESW